MERFLSYDYYNGLNMKQLFENKIYIKQLGFKTTNFDMLVNLLYFKNPNYGHIYDIDEHIHHEHEIIQIIRKFTIFLVYESSFMFHFANIG